MSIPGWSFRCIMCFRIYFVFILGSFNSFKRSMVGANFSLFPWFSFYGSRRGGMASEVDFD